MAAAQPSVEGALDWRPLARDDLPLLGRWLAEPGVARWWNHESSPEAVERDFGPSVRGEEPGEDLVLLLAGRPVGLLQRSRIRDYAEDVAELSEVVDVPQDAWSLDYLLGEPALRGRGLGSRVLAWAVERTWVDHPLAGCILVPVVAANRPSWRALERAGLRRVASGDLTPDNPVDDRRHHVYRVDRPA